jgi:gliding motility-associated-like protein
MYIRRVLIILLILATAKSYCQQQDVDFHLNASFLPGKTVLKVKRDFYDPYVWVLAKNNEVYRINSITKIVDNYTPQFAVYNGLQFIDIAGRSKDTVFIATNSTNVIQYKQGSIRLITAADGIPYTLNSIGMEKAILDLAGVHTLMIGTDKGFCTYDMDAEKAVAVQDNGISKVFEATYRRQIYKDSTLANSDRNTGDTIQYLPVVHKGEFTTFVEYLWEGGKQFGYNINTVYNITASIYGYDDLVDYASLVWGNSRGLFQNNSNDSYSSTSPHAHYLDGMNVNKVTSIYGLVAFGNGWWSGDPRYIKENLLVGTDQGLYFSSSYYNQYTYGALRNFSLFHYDELGNVRVNDICVNAASITEPICEDGVWLACDNGLYLIKPDYGKYLNNQQFKVVSFKGLPDTISSVNICTGSIITALINTSVYSGNTIQWYKDGNELPAQTKDSLVISKSGDYYSVLYDPCENIHLESNHLKIQTISAPVFSFGYPDDLRYCQGTPVNLKTDDNPAYHYRWSKDGALSGDTLFNINATQSGKYKVEVSTCQNSWVPSKEVQVDLINLPVPTIFTDKPDYCLGDNAKFSVSVPADPSYTINWYKDNVLLSSQVNQTSVTISESGNYAVAITAGQANTDGTICKQISAVQTIIFNPPPTASIEKIIRTSMCDGQTVDLKVNYSTGAVKWSNGETSGQITVSNSGNYQVTLTTNAGCTTEASINVQFFPNPVLNIFNAGVCAESHKAVTLTAPAGMASYLWNGQPGSETYTTDHQQTVTLIITDANGCQASQQIQVSDECPDIKIPNAFTPNGDGINDTWGITGLEYDQTALVLVFTRYGQQVYQSKGYGTAWDGEFQGKRLQAGAYYYIISAKNGSLTYSGEVTILY